MHCNRTCFFGGDGEGTGGGGTGGSAGGAGAGDHGDGHGFGGGHCGGGGGRGGTVFWMSFKEGFLQSKLTWHLLCSPCLAINLWSFCFCLLSIR